MIGQIKNTPEKIEKKKYVSQGDIGFSSGEILESDAFTQCSAVIMESENACALVHVEPSGLRRDQMLKIKKYFENMGPVRVVTFLGPNSWDKQIGIVVKQQLNIDVESERTIKIEELDKDKYWAIEYNPSNGKALVTQKDGEHQIIPAFNPRFEVSNWNEKQSDFEKQDYMPPGFRLMQKHFDEMDYWAEEHNYADRWIKYDVPIRVLANGWTPSIWTPNAGLIEIKGKDLDMTLADYFREKIIPESSLFIVSYEKKPEDYKDYDKKKGTFQAYQIERDKLFWKYSDEFRKANKYHELGDWWDKKLDEAKEYDRTK